jgi:hypothetical protein
MSAILFFQGMSEVALKESRFSIIERKELHPLEGVM